MTNLPTGTVTFLFTDVEGSTSLLQRFGEEAGALFDAHDQILSSAIADHQGTTIRTEGDAFFAVFQSASDALAAAVAAQRALGAYPWPADGSVRVRMGLHTGAGELGGADYRGIDVHRAARIGAAGHGGQILVSAATAALVRESLDAARLIDLGEHRFKDLLQLEQVFQVAADGLDEVFPPIRSLDPVKHNLPSEVTSFIPRPEVGRIIDLLKTHRLVTLTGPGGTGKSRLSLQVATEASEDFETVYFVALAAVMEPHLVAATIASTLGLTRSSASAERLVIDYLQGRRSLLVLDNFEQILDEAPLVARMVAATAGLKVLVTSRAALQVAGEQEYPVPPLAIPNGETSLEALRSKAAVALFIDRASASVPDFELTAENSAAVAEITKRLDGLPLAIELAASRVKVLSPAAMAERLRASFDVLSTTRRDLPPRQQTLRNAIAWSYDLLTPDEQRLLRALSVFRGGATYQAIESVCGKVVGSGQMDLLDSLETLVHHSLVRYDPSQVMPRYSMLETIREFSWTRLTETDDCRLVQEAHLAAHVELAEKVGPHLTGNDQADWLDIVQRERDNFRAAFAFAESTGRTEQAARIIASMWRYLQKRGLIAEGRGYASRVLESGGLDPALMAQVLRAAGGLAYWAADIEETGRLYNEAVALARSLGDERVLAEALYDASFPYLMAYQDHETAGALLDEAEALFTGLGSSHGIAEVTWARGVGAASIGEFDKTLEYAMQSLPMFATEGDATMAAWAHHMTATAMLGLDQIEGALRHICQALDMFEPVRDVSGMILQLQSLNQLCLRTGDFANAIVLAGAIATQQHATGMNLSEVAVNANLGLEPAYEALGNDAAQEMFDRGLAMSLAEAVALARSIIG